MNCSNTVLLFMYQTDEQMLSDSCGNHPHRWRHQQGRGDMLFDEVVGKWWFTDGVKMTVQTYTDIFERPHGAMVQNGAKR